MHVYIQGKRDRDLEKLSPAMWELLWEANAHDGRAPYDTMRLSTRRALEGKGLLDGWQITTMGRRALLAEFQHPPEKPSSALAAMEQEQREDYADYLRRCGGVPISHVKP